jgi:hypothetical protein
VNDELAARARRICEHSVVREWEYRQRNFSKGVWYRFRRLLVDAAEAWVIDEAAADELEARGHLPHPVGRELEPPKRLFFLTVKELEALSRRRQVPLRLQSELLLARSLVFLALPGAAGPVRERPE